MQKPPTEDLTPWYKQFWPWFLIALPASVVVASLNLVYVAFKHADSVVSDNYYKEGKAINQVVVDLNRAQTLDLNAKLFLSDGVLNITLTGNQPVQPKSIQVSFLHPADSKMDHHVFASHLGNQRYLVELGEIPAGRWYIDVKPSEGEDNWRLKGELIAPFEQVDLKANP